MANLETLELTINANASAATTGLNNLITTLGSMRTALAPVITALERLNLQLSTLKGFGINPGSFAGKGGMAKSTNPYGIDSVKQAMGMLNNAKMTDLMNRKLEETGRQYLVNAYNGKLNNKQLVDGAVAVRNLQSNVEKLNSSSTVLGKLKNSFQGVGSSISRIAKTMLIRTAIKALIKNFQQAWESAYQFSKKLNGQFAKSVDNIKGSLQSMAIDIVRAFAPLVQVLSPVFSVIATGIKYLTNAIIGLLRLLGAVSEMFGATAANIAEAGGAAGGSAKEIVASFDELNVLDSSGGGGGGGGSGGKNFLNGFEEEIETVKVIVGEALLAVGLILTFSGHTAVGLGLAAVGAASIVGTITENWGTIPNKIKGEIATIMALAGASFLAIGCILAFSGVKTGLGIALIAAGAANLITAASLSWNLDKTIKEKIGNVTGIMGTGLLAIGAVLAFTGANIPLGVGMMAVGGVSLASAIALNWDTLKGTIINTFVTIKKRLVELWDRITDAVSKAWNAFLNWGSATWESIKAGWETIKTKLSSVWIAIKDYVTSAWDAFTKWAEATWANIQAAWEDIKKGLSDVWNSVKTAIGDAWTSVETWINATWETIGQGWETIKTKFEWIWTSIQNAFDKAWEAIKKFWEDPLSYVKQAWNGVVQWLLDNVINPVRELFGMELITLDIDDITDITGEKDLTDKLTEAIKGAVSTSATPDKIRKLKEAFPGLKATDIVTITDWTELNYDLRNNLISSIVAAYGAEGIKAIKSKFPLIDATELVKISNWKGITLQEKFAFINALKDAFGAADTLAALKKYGIDIAELINQGMKSKDPDIQQQAKKWSALIKEGVEEQTPVVSAEVEAGAGEITGLKKEIETKCDPSVSVKVGADTTGINSLASQIKKALSGKILVKGGGNNVMTLTLETKAAGGIVSADMFLANENGVPEMVGRFGNQTAVANTDQIVDGISKGVSDANQEQNELLRQQNSILRSILQKDSSVRLSASSALGRTVRQSLDMYSMATGV